MTIVTVLLIVTCWFVDFGILAENVPLDLPILSVQPVTSPDDRQLTPDNMATQSHDQFAQFNVKEELPHLVSSFGTGTVLNMCQICGKLCGTPANLRIHGRTHTGERPYKCGLCGKGFINTSNLKVHMRTHTREKPYKCNLCDKHFSHINNKKLHMATYHQVSPN